MYVEWKAYGAEVSWNDADGRAHEVTVIPVDVEIRRFVCLECDDDRCEHVQAAVRDIIDRESER